jgi:hypothetical protein
VRLKIGRAVLVIVCLGGALRASAQSIRPADYLPLGQGAQWQYERVAGSGPASLHLEVTEVNVVDTGTRYSLEVPSGDLHLGLRLEFTTEGSLRLRAIEADLNELLDDLPLDPSATADVQFMPPVLLGEASVVPGSAVVETPIDTVFDADLETNIGQVDLDVHATGMMTATWDPASAVDSPAGSFSDVVGFTLDVFLRFAEDVFDTEGEVNVRLKGVLARGVGFVQLEVDETSYALVRAIVNGMPIGDFPQYEDLVGLAFTIPPVICLHGRALGEATAGGITLHDIRLSQKLYGKAQLDAVLDHPAASGVPITMTGPTKAKADGSLRLELNGKTTILDQKVKFHVEQRLFPTSTTFDLTVKVGKTKTVIPIGIVPIVTGDVRIGFDGFVDQSANPGSERTLVSNGRLLLGEVEYQIVAKEKLKVKKDGTHKHTYNVRQDNDTVVVNAEATATNAADFAFSKLKATIFKREVKKSQLTGVTAVVVEPEP